MRDTGLRSLGAEMKKRSLTVFGAVAGVMLLVAGCGAPPEDVGPVDLEAPQILSVTVAPDPVTPGQDVTISATVTDNVGVDSVAFLVGRNGTPSGFCTGNATLTSGTATLGVWELTCTAPALLNAGTYQAGTAAVDARLNATATAEDSPENVRGLFEVSGETNDMDAPVIDSVTTTPASASPGAPVTISAHITDVTGVANVGFVVRKDMTDTMDWCAEGATLVSGTPTDGTWELTCVVGASAQGGSYRVNTAAAVVLNNFGGIGDEGVDAVAGPFTVVLNAG